MLIEKLNKIVIGDPMDPKVNLGPLAIKKNFEDLKK
jgi:acyl-CoA reductase-like NAD-dependent aldehyde dehydrogenase